ncbi:hypothetical protein B7P43_G12205 [Cryptotermes secundus]|uniref:PSP proline-rich domain-containing protein n=1 Tax=Cryptotermes secundus TaxID=105785 RepID=A0A2J7PD18_9NEOP|nr:hypothetical protein B7P43_G12205 [Cryptotermes secundus]
MSVDRDSKIMLDDSIDNDSTCVSGSTSNNEESFDSYSSERKYKAAIKNFLKDLIAKHDPDCDEDTSDLELDVWEAGSDDCQDHGIDDSDLFTVDTRPTIKDELDVPAYSQKFGEVLQKAKEDSGKTNENGEPSRSSCFNCLGTHSLRDCPLPRDPLAISRNRRQFSARFGQTPNKTSRYHLDDEQKFASLVPGQISSKLRKALGLGRHHLPKHIYRMRLLGYPPGWMEEARISHSGLTLYDSQGKEVAEPYAEEGEIFAEGSRDKYDINKIISYPGFNVPYSPDTIDDFELHQCPPMRQEQSKEQMTLQLSQNSVRAYKRRRISPPNPGPATRLEDQDLTQADMEVEETAGNSVNLLPADDNCKFIPPLPKETPPRLPPPPPPSPPPQPSCMGSDSEGGESRSQGIASPLSMGQSGMSSPRAPSPSLSDLETRKQLLLAELEDGESSRDTLQKAAASGTPRPSISSLGRVKFVDLGTPVLQGSSPYSCLPNPEKFSHDICDVINFENLPDSTGKYEKMSDIIRKVRTVVTRIQQEDDDDDNCEGRRK